MKKQLIWIGAIVAIIVAVLVGGLAGKVVTQTAVAPTAEDVLPKMVAGVAQMAPKMVDADTRVDRASAGPGKRFTYHYTLVNYPAPGQNASEILGRAKDLEALMIKNTCANAATKPIRALGITVAYEYSSKDGKRLLEVEVPPEKCPA